MQSLLLSSDVRGAGAGSLVAAGHGPPISTLDLLSILAFMLNCVVAPVSVVCVLVAVMIHRSHRPLWLAPVAVLNLAVVTPQLAAGHLDDWLAALLWAQAVCAVLVLIWALRARRSSPASPARGGNPYYRGP